MYTPAPDLSSRREPSVYTHIPAVAGGSIVSICTQYGIVKLASLPPAARGTTATMPVRPSLVKLEAEYRAKELKARIRAQKMMSQGGIFSQVVEGPAVPPH
jgi:hypothetical protein